MRLPPAPSAASTACACFTGTAPRGWSGKAGGAIAAPASLTDLGSHLLDTLAFWLPDAREWKFRLRAALCHENAAPDHVMIDAAPPGGPFVQLEMALVSWRNHFTADLFGESGSVHIDSLCKWGPSRFTQRTRVLPSGRPPEEGVTLVEDDPTWASEYAHFVGLCEARAPCSLENDIWINRVLFGLARDAGIDLGSVAA